MRTQDYPTPAQAPRVLSAMDILALLGLAAAGLLLANYLDIFVLGPLSVVPPVLLGLFLMRRREEPFSGIGIRKPARPLRFALLVPVTVVVAIVFSSLVQALAGAILDTHPDLEALGEIEGNLPQALLLLSIAWTTAAVGEELLFRGLIMRKLELIFGSTRVMLVLAVLVQAIIFGLAHSYQGAVGMIGAGAVGVALGAMYYFGKRNIWLCVIAHGVQDTIGIIALYFGVLATNNNAAETVAALLV
jgi:CAAX protease family protein